MASLLSATMRGLVIMALSTPGVATRRIPGAPVRSSRNGRMVPSGHGDRQHRRGLPRVRSQWNDERLAMIRQALETEGGRRVIARPGSRVPTISAPVVQARAAKPTRSAHGLAPGSGRGASPRTATRGPKTRRAPLGPNRRPAARTERPHAVSYAPPPVGAVADPLSHA